MHLQANQNSNSHGARPVHLIITMIKWIRTVDDAEPSMHLRANKRRAHQKSSSPEVGGGVTFG